MLERVEGMTTQLAPLRAADPVLPPSLARPVETSAPAPRAAAAPVLPNPQLRLDAALGLVVIEFRDRGGESRTIPTERELDAYRANGQPGDVAVTSAPDSAVSVAATAIEAGQPARS